MTNFVAYLIWQLSPDAEDTQKLTLQLVGQNVYDRFAYMTGNTVGYGGKGYAVPGDDVYGQPSATLEFSGLASGLYCLCVPNMVLPVIGAGFGTWTIRIAADLGAPELLSVR